MKMFRTKDFVSCLFEEILEFKVWTFVKDSTLLMMIRVAIKTVTVTILYNNNDLIIKMILKISNSNCKKIYKMTMAIVFFFLFNKCLQFSLALLFIHLGSGPNLSSQVYFLVFFQFQSIQTSKLVLLCMICCV